MFHSRKQQKLHRFHFNRLQFFMGTFENIKVYICGKLISQGCQINKVLHHYSGCVRKIQGATTTKIFIFLVLMLNFLLSFLKSMLIKISVNSESQLIGPPCKLGKKSPASLGLKIQGGQKLCYFIAKIKIFLYLINSETFLHHLYEYVLSHTS